VTSLQDHFPFSVFYVLLAPARPPPAAGAAARRAPGVGPRHGERGAPRVALLLAGRPPELPRPRRGPPAPRRARAAARRRRRARPAPPPRARGGGGGERAFRTAWEQAAAADLPARLGGLAAALAPRPGPTSRRTPWGSSSARPRRGSACSTWPSRWPAPRRRARLAVAALAAALVVGVPARSSPALGTRTGIVRAQDPAVVQAAADAARILGGGAPTRLPPETSPRGREACRRASVWTRRRRSCPRGPAAAGARGARRPRRPLGLRDVRLVALLALAALGASPPSSGAASGGPPGPRAPRSAPRRRDRARLAGGPVPRRARRSVGRRAGGRRARPGRWPAPRWPSTTARRSPPPSSCSPSWPGAAARGRSGGPPSPTCCSSRRSRSSIPGPSPRVSRARRPGPASGCFNLLAYRGAEASALALASPRSRRCSRPSPSCGSWLRRWPPLALAGIASLVRDRARAGRLGGGGGAAGRPAGPGRDGAGGRRRRGGGAQASAPGVIRDGARGDGAGGGTRTRTDFSTRPSNVRVCQFHHSGTGGGERPSMLGRDPRRVNAREHRPLPAALQRRRWRGRPRVAGRPSPSTTRAWSPARRFAVDARPRLTTAHVPPPPLPGALRAHPEEVVMAEFRYVEPSDPVAKEETPYRHVASDLVSVARFDGEEVLKVAPEALTLVAREAFRDVSFLYRPGPPRAARRDPRRPRGLRERPRGGARAPPQRRGRLRLRPPDVPGHRHGHDRRQEGPARLDRGRDEEHLSRGVFETYARENLRYSQTVPLTMYDEGTRDEPAGADRPLRDGRHGVPLPDDREGRRVGEQDAPLPGDEGAPQPREPR
jgi:hypothetical protein